MKAVFLSDNHLKREKDAGYRHLMDFFDLLWGRTPGICEQQVGQEYCDKRGNGKIIIDDLFIAGDLFDFWFCRNDLIYPEFSAVVGKLKELKTRGIGINLCEGNHDFSLKEYFSEQLGMAVFPDWAIIDSDGLRIFVSHGDMVDRSNVKYLLLRKILRSIIFYRLQRCIPISTLWSLARISSNMSKGLSLESEDRLAEKMEAFSMEKFKEGFDAVILGHCHKPSLKKYVLEDRERTFATLGDWISRYPYLYYEDGLFTLSYYRSSP